MSSLIALPLHHLEEYSMDALILADLSLKYWLSS